MTTVSGHCTVLTLTRERWQTQRDHFADILRVQRQYQDLKLGMRRLFFKIAR